MGTIIEFPKISQNAPEPQPPAVVTNEAAAPAQFDQPIKELRIRFQRLPDGYSSLDVRIDDSGNLVLDGADAGEYVRQFWGDWDYEYSETVPASWKDTVLLHLMKERFTETTAFREWCNERRIPYKFDSWV